MCVAFKRTLSSPVYSFRHEAVAICHLGQVEEYAVTAVVKIELLNLRLCRLLFHSFLLFIQTFLSSLHGYSTFQFVFPVSLASIIQLFL